MKKNDMFVPFSVPSIGEEEIEEVVAVLRSGWLTSGSRTERFEQEFRKYVQAPTALAVNSCTAGLHLALSALGIGPGDEVITTPITFCATVNTILHVGAKPILADIGTDGNIDPESILNRISNKTRAIIPVHLGGLPCDMKSIWSMAKERGIHVIEDAAHAAGTFYHGRPIGASDLDGNEQSDAVAFSFYATKNLTTGEGGMVTTGNQKLMERMRRLCLHGINKDAWNRYSEHGNWYYEVTEVGFKYNLSDIQSAIGIHQLRKLDRLVEIRTRRVEQYNRLLADIPEIELPATGENCKHAWHLYMIRLNLQTIDIARDEFIKRLKIAGVGASVHFIPIPLHGFFAAHANEPRNQVPRALELYPRIVSLPLHAELTPEQVEYVAKVVKDIVVAAKKNKAFVLK